MLKRTGASKADVSQIEYVEVEKETLREVVDSDDANMFVKIKRWFSGVLNISDLMK